ncbi:hypothetical protein ABT282_30935 [Streptomyces sp. NPDC000927]|uniref:hypothetical protein n=1 Tax=Streptomyces sp. NPDC000927 TaxID=3154371 RepID=UPI00332BE2E1
MGNRRGPLPTDKKTRSYHVSTRRAEAVAEMAGIVHLSASGLVDSLFQMVLDGEIPLDSIRPVPSLPPITA